MSNEKDFVIEAGVLENYTGSDENVVISDGVTSIGWRAFSGCSSLKSITIPDSVRSIGEDAFFECSSLKSVTIPESLTDIHPSAFDGCPDVTFIRN